MQKDPQIYLAHMLDAAKETQHYICGRTRDDYDRDRMLRRSLERVIEVIGEAARLVPAPLRDQYPEILWAAVIGIRHRIVHDYLNVDAAILWDTVVMDIPPLIALLEKIVPPEMRDEP